MKIKNGYKRTPLSFNRFVVIASASVTKEKNTIHAFTEIDITEPRRMIKEYFDRKKEKLSFTAYIVSCLAQVVKDYPQLNSFIKGRNQIFLEDVNISVLVEKDIKGEKVPEPLVIKQAQLKTYLEINNEIKDAKKFKSNNLGSLSGLSWIRFVPNYLLKVFIRLADKNISMAKRYGKIAVTAVGMFTKEEIWFIPHGSGTVLITVGSISNKIIEVDGEFVSREHLCLTASFDHNIVDGAPASRFMNQFIEAIKSGKLVKLD
jgi:pyruvate/2-oxoglutarate dehydrogenase complex dihydrolipoamide acyltransferase (E2) component